MFAGRHRCRARNPYPQLQGEWSRSWATWPHPSTALPRPTLFVLRPDSNGLPYLTRLSRVTCSFRTVGYRLPLRAQGSLLRGVMPSVRSSSPFHLRGGEISESGPWVCLPFRCRLPGPLTRGSIPSSGQKPFRLPLTGPTYGARSLISGTVGNPTGPIGIWPWSPLASGLTIPLSFFPVWLISPTCHPLPLAAPPAITASDRPVRSASRLTARPPA